VSVAAFLSELHRLDVRLWLEGDRLRCNARAGALTDELREQLRQRKNDIVSFLRLADAAAAASAIVPLQKQGAKTPVFAVPPHGDVFCYRELAQALGEERPFFGLQAPGVDGKGEPLERIEDLAAYFADQIRAFRPNGPWIIAGYCMGGTIAFDLARRLLASESAGFLALFGVPYPAFFCRTLHRPRLMIENRIALWRRRARVLAAQSWDERYGYLKWRLQRRTPAPDPSVRARDQADAITLNAVRAYQPQRFAGGRVHHFVPYEAWLKRVDVQAQRWRSLAGHVETYHGPDGCHHDEMLQGAYAAVFAQHFRLSCGRAGF
jgi:thioesterase domain-containing protein